MELIPPEDRFLDTYYVITPNDEETKRYASKLERMIERRYRRGTDERKAIVTYQGPDQDIIIDKLSVASEVIVRRQVRSTEQDIRSYRTIEDYIARGVVYNPKKGVKVFLPPRKPRKKETRNEPQGKDYIHTRELAKTHAPENASKIGAIIDYMISRFISDIRR